MAAENQNQTPNQDDLDNNELLKALREAIGPEVSTVKSTMDTVDFRKANVEDFQITSLLLDKIINNESYSEERDKFYEEVAKQSSIDLSENATNNANQFEMAFLRMTSLPKEHLKEIAPIAFKDLFEEIEEQFPISKSKRMLSDAGVIRNGISGPAWGDLAETNQTAYAFHQKFGDPNFNYESGLKQAAPQINQAFMSMSFDSAKKFGMLSVMTAATGGTNLVMKAGIFAVRKAISNKRLRDNVSKGISGFDSFLQKRGVDTSPLHKAKDLVQEKSKKIGEKLEGTKWGKVIKTSAVLGAVAVASLAIGDFEIESISQGVSEMSAAVKGVAVDAGNGFGDTVSQAIYNGEILGNEISAEVSRLTNDAGEYLSKTVAGEYITEATSQVKTYAEEVFEAAKEHGSGLADAISETAEKTNHGEFERGRMIPDTSELNGVENNVSANEPEAPVNTLPPEEQVATTQIAGSEPKLEESSVKEIEPIPETPSGTESQGSTHGSEVNSEKGDHIEAIAHINEIKVESGSNIYSAVKEHLTAVNGVPPSEQAVMQASADILEEHGLEPEKVPAGFSFEFNHEDYAYVDKVSQDTVDLARLGPDGIPTSMQNLTVAQVASGKLENAGLVDAQINAQMMREVAINGAVKADLQAAIDKGLDPNTTMTGFISAIESKTAQLDPQAGNVEKASLDLKDMASKMGNVSIPEGHAGPTDSAGNPRALEHHYEEIRKHNSDVTLG